jgi:hypothetical protein
MREARRRLSSGERAIKHQEKKPSAIPPQPHITLNLPHLVALPLTRKNLVTQSFLSVNSTRIAPINHDSQRTGADSTSSELQPHTHIQPHTCTPSHSTRNKRKSTVQSKGKDLAKWPKPITHPNATPTIKTRATHLQMTPFIHAASPQATPNPTYPTTHLH